MKLNSFDTMLQNTIDKTSDKNATNISSQSRLDRSHKKIRYILINRLIINDK